MKSFKSKFTGLFTLLFFTISTLSVYAQVVVGNTSLTEREVINGLNIPWEIK